LEDTAIRPIKTRKENSLLAIISNQKIINIICLIVIISSPFIVYRRIMIDWVAPQNIVNSLSNIHGLSMGIPFYFIILMYIIFYFPNLGLFNWLDKIINIKLVSSLAIIAIVICFICFLIKVPASLGSWTTIATVCAGMLWFYSILQSKLRNILAFTCAIGIMGIWIGIWEIPYQTALKLVYDMPQVGSAIAIQWIVWEWVIEVPMAGCGLWILVELNRKYKIVTINKWFWIFLGIYVILIAYWIISGFWVDVWYDWTLHKWIQTPEFSKLMMFVYKTSKVMMMLALVSLVWRRNEKFNNYSMLDYA
jgi:hypothetical protein